MTWHSGYVQTAFKLIEECDMPESILTLLGLVGAILLVALAILVLTLASKINREGRK